MEKAKGIITKGVGGLYTVLTDSGAVNCPARGVFRHEKITPMAGDKVEISPTEDGSYVISGIIERKNFLIRPAVANLTHLFAVIPAANPSPDLAVTDKLISGAEDKNVEPCIIVTKADISPENAGKINKIYTLSGFSVFLTDASGGGDEAISDYIKGASEDNTVVAAFAGVSGAGKSTLMSRLFPSLRLKTGEISKKISRGRHTTRVCELYPLNIGSNVCFIADTPGFSMIDFTKFNFVEEENLPYSFREFAPLMGRCRYTKCTHTKEEGCAVLEALRAGKIPPSRHESYILMRDEILKNPPWKRG